MEKITSRCHWGYFDVYGCGSWIGLPRLFFVWRCFPIATNAHQINEEIRNKEVRLISESGEQLGVMSAMEAQRIAEEKNLDLVKISPNAVPPVCKVMDYGKFRFEQTKREKEARKNQRVVEIKEVRMSPSIDVNDFNVKQRNAQKFLADGNRCKVTVRFRGRDLPPRSPAFQMRRLAPCALPTSAPCAIHKQKPLRPQGLLSNLIVRVFLHFTEFFGIL